ncbi:MAG: ACP S-malonyltransferase [Gammaproteobacteria bacterium]|nr:ACP S-malonyltransferase [Gammaproteobacteria bacterium]NIM71804.1 ACP S-malonyltransferase [Gammaproteobacteria bacterium]NIN37926.1 ACP S-malonyltransferase [Gammaproteobacteria bacterium]NIO23560.1 ACP S-malonyltransferase [Gammaproteobacteria bacterium]NIO64176.1 ACP S-malonyltransferase [Gammaproteobacteria bacterium]
MSLAFTFPGQGSQSIGMLADLANDHPQVEETFAEASEVLGYDLWALTQDGPEARLNATEQTQPAMLAAGVAVARVWRRAGGPTPTLAAGHSLGEYSALVCADSLAFADAVSLVAARGRFMQEAVPEGQGAIAALLGLDDARVLEVCASASDRESGSVVSAVNFNAPGQVVIAGHAGAVEKAIAMASEAGAKRAIKLPMSVPVHCELMEPARERLVAKLDATSIDAPAFPVIHNADNEAHDDPAAIRGALADQLTRPVRWVESVRALAGRGASVLVEPGPGRVLTGLGKRIDRGLKTLAVHDSTSLEQALTEIRELV